jgi:hypothetical protein
MMTEACISYLVLHDFSNDLFSEPESSKEVSPISPDRDEREDGSISQLWDPFNIGEEGGATLFKDLAVFEGEACASIDKEYPFFDYAATQWFEHFATSNFVIIFGAQDISSWSFRCDQISRAQLVPLLLDTQQHRVINAPRLRGSGHCMLFWSSRNLRGRPTGTR